MEPVIIAGGGWAGLAAAAELCRCGVPVTVLEAAAAPGGRARRVALDGLAVDSGQHLFLGAYRETLALLQRLGVPESRVFARTPLQLHIRSAQRAVKLSLARYPAPLHLVRGLQDISGLSLGEKLRAVRLGLSLARHRAAVHPDVNVDQWLRQRQQTASLIREIWEPFCLATLNTPAAEASTEVFLQVLHDAFLRSREDSDLLIPTANLSAIVPDPAAAYVAAHGGAVRLVTPVTGLVMAQDRVAAVDTARGRVSGARYIIALPFGPCRALLEPHAPFAELCARLARVTPMPICTVFMRYPRPIALEAPFVGIIDDPACWLFSRAHQGQPDIVAVVITGAGAHLDMQDAALVETVAAHLARYYPRWPASLGGAVVRDRQAAFACRTGVNAFRPGNRTPVPNCWLAGDFTATGYPATLEGAVASGVKAAREVLDSLR